MELQPIDYNSVFAEFNALDLFSKVECMENEIAYIWLQEYKKICPNETNAFRFNYYGYTFVYDDIDRITSTEYVNEIPVQVGRVISAFGISRVATEKRNLSRTKGYLGKTSKVYARFGGIYDKGHFMANAIGGPLEINLFPQLREINQGWSNEGKEYRQMEKYIAANPGCFVFSRPIYNDLTERPMALEFGYITLDGQFVNQIFPNI